MKSRVETKGELLQRLAESGETIRGLGVAELGVFGSFARDEAGEESDVDFFVHFREKEKTYNNFMELWDYLETLTGRAVTVVTPQSWKNSVLSQTALKAVEYVAI